MYAIEAQAITRILLNHNIKEELGLTNEPHFIVSSYVGPISKLTTQSTPFECEEYSVEYSQSHITLL